MRAAIAALPRFRAHAESRMGAENSGSTVRIRRKGTVPVQNEENGISSYPWTDVYAAQPARLGPLGASSASRHHLLTPGGVTVEQAARTLHLPATTTGLVDGDVAEVINGEVAGTFWRILEATWLDQVTAHRVAVQQIDMPEGWDS